MRDDRAAASRSSTATSGLRIVHTFEDEDDRGDLYDFCPREGAPPRSSREHDARRARERARRRPPRRDRGRRSTTARPITACARASTLSTPPSSIRTETAFGWLARDARRHASGRRDHGRRRLRSPSAAPACTRSSARADGAILLTLFRAVGWMSRGDLSTRAGHAGYNVPTPDAQGLGRLTFRYAARRRPRRGARGRAGARPAARGRRSSARRPPIARSSSVEPPACASRSSSAPTTATRSSCACAAPRGRGHRAPPLLPSRAAAPRGPDLDERDGPALPLGGRDELTVPIAAGEVVTLRVMGAGG